MRERVRFLFVIYGLLLTAAGSAALKPTRPKFKIATSSTTSTTKEPEPEEPEVTTVQTDVNATTGRTLTGIPQIDYIWDPNLPRELNGYNLSSYPFYSTVPTEDINFKCDGLHDGFYASIEHKCQVYHHCLYGTRYDFLCANFTAFDQKTFICHFASEVDCANSKKYWHRNDALYQATTTTTSSTTTTTTVAPPRTPAAPALPPERPTYRDRDTNRRRRPFRRRPAYDYYDDEYYDDEYDRTRPRGYDRRDSYEYDDRNYRADIQRDRNRDRDRDRDYRDPVRDHIPRHRAGSLGYTPTRDGDNQRPLYDDRDQREREKIPMGRPGRRDRKPIDQFDEDSRPLVGDRPRDSDVAGYSDAGKGLASEDRRKELPDLRARDSPRDTDDRRYSDKRYRNDYDDKNPTPVATGAADGLVKPVAPSTSVYARPRAPPKIRRPVPVSEQGKYAYNISSGATGAPAEEQPRRRPDPVDDDYLDDDLEDARPRRPNRRRPAYRDKELSYDARENRDRDRDRNYRTRYQDETEDEVLPRKRPDRPRDRHYERGDRPQTYERDRPAIDRGVVSPAVAERPVSPYPSRSAERPIGLGHTRPSNRDEDFNRPKFPAREREPPVPQSEAPKKPSQYHQRTEKTFGDNPPQTFRSRDGHDDLDADEEPRDVVREKNVPEKNTEQSFSQPEVIPEQPSARPSSASRGSQKYSSSENPSDTDYRSGSSAEYYDEPDELPASPRTTLRVVKRPFLPSRGGNPNPRGLKQVGLRVEPKLEEGSSGRPARINPADDGIAETLEDRDYRRQPYDAYRTVQSDGRPQEKDEAADESVATRPQSRRFQKEDSSSDQEDAPKSTDQRESSSDDLDNRSNYNRQSSQLRNGQIPSESSRQEGPSVTRNEEKFDGKKPNEVVHRLQDIPESEYDERLNDALTPTLTQESSLPSGFILPLHSQLDRDTNLQSSQRNYLLTRPAEPVAQLKSLPHFAGSNSYPVPPIVERSRTTFPRQSPGSIFASGHQQAPWQGYVEY